MEIRQLAAEETALHRTLRLQALRDSPDSFGGTLAEEQKQPPSYWRDQTEAVTAPGRNVMFIAHDGSTDCGMIYGLRDPKNTKGARIGGMWVQGSMRRQGIGRLLLEATLDWARENGMTQAGLWAPADSVAAISFYRRMGFSDTGERAELRKGSQSQILGMTRHI